MNRKMTRFAFGLESKTWSTEKPRFGIIAAKAAAPRPMPEFSKKDRRG